MGACQYTRTLNSPCFHQRGFASLSFSRPLHHCIFLLPTSQLSLSPSLSPSPLPLSPSPLALALPFAHTRGHTNARHTRGHTHAKADSSFSSRRTKTTIPTKKLDADAWHKPVLAMHCERASSTRGMKCFRRAFLGNLIGRAEPAIALGPVRAQTHALIAVGDGFVPHAKTCIGSAAVAEVLRASETAEAAKPPCQT